MKRYAALCGSVVAVMMLLFVLCEALAVPVLTDRATVRSLSGVLAGVSGVTLLVVDVVLPVPSSVVMIMHGTLFGVPLGMVLSMAGSLGSFAVGFALGRRGASLAARIVTDHEHRRADAFFRRWGAVGIILSRPVPILAETVSLAAGASPLRWQPALAAAAVGYLPAAAVYAVAGAWAANFAQGVAVFIAVIVLAACSAVIVVGRSRSVPEPTG